MSDGSVKNAILFPNVDYYLRHKETSNQLDGSNHASSDSSVYKMQPGLSNPYQMWQLLPSAFEGYWQLKQQETGKVLDGNDAGNIYKSGGGSPSNGYQCWNIRDAEEAGFVYLKSQATHLQLDGDDGNNVYGKSTGLPNGYQMWGMIPANLDITANFVDIEYGQPEKPPTTTKDFLESEEINNKSNASSLSETVTCSQTLTSTFSWSLTETIGGGLKITATAKVPLLASASAELSLTLSMGSTQQQTTSTAMAYTASSNVTVPPHQDVNVKGYVDWAADVSTPFTLTLDIAASIGGNPLGVADLENLLAACGSTGTIVETFTNTIRVTFKGNFTGSYGIQTYTEVDDVTH